jgi:hypothetical protein
LRPFTRTSFHHQPEAQHPKSSAIHKLAGRLPNLDSRKQTRRRTVGAAEMGALQRRRSTSRSGHLVAAQYRSFWAHERHFAPQKISAPSLPLCQREILRR